MSLYYQVSTYLQELLQQRKRLSLVLSKHTSLLEILELPQLVENAVRNQVNLKFKKFAQFTSWLCIPLEIFAGIWTSASTSCVCGTDRQKTGSHSHCCPSRTVCGRISFHHGQPATGAAESSSSGTLYYLIVNAGLLRATHKLFGKTRSY